MKQPKHLGKQGFISQFQADWIDTVKEWTKLLTIIWNSSPNYQAQDFIALLIQLVKKYIALQLDQEELLSFQKRMIDSLCQPNK